VAYFSAIATGRVFNRRQHPWTRSTKYIVSIYRKAATARLDEFIGPKT
jgi:hypothetical protein